MHAHAHCLLACVGLFKAHLRSCCESKVLPFIHVITGLLGITRYLACSMPNSTTQPVSMYRKPLHFQLVTNGRCVAVSNKISSSKRAGSKGQQPVNGCSSDCKAVTETEVATIVHLKQAFEDVSHPIHATSHNTLY